METEGQESRMKYNLPKTSSGKYAIISKSTGSSSKLVENLQKANKFIILRKFVKMQPKNLPKFFYLAILEMDNKNTTTSFRDCIEQAMSSFHVEFL